MITVEPKYNCLDCRNYKNLYTKQNVSYDIYCFVLYKNDLVGSCPCSECLVKSMCKENCNEFLEFVIHGKIRKG